MSTEEFFQSIEELGPRFAERATGCEIDRKVPEESIKELLKNGILRSLQPKRYGGQELSPVHYYPGLSRIAEFCPSTAWVTGIVMVHSWQLGLFGKRAQEDVWSKDPTTLISSSYMPATKAKKVSDGYLISGRWSFSSGCQHCDWAFLGGFVPEGEATWGGLPDIRTFLVPKTDYRIDLVWDTVGMAGTGSHDIVIEEAFVPEYRTLPFANVVTNDIPGWEFNNTPLFHAPFAAIFVNTLAATAIGNARACVDLFLQRCRSKVANAKPGKDPLEPSFSVVAAEAVASIDAIELQRKHNLEEMMNYAERGEIIPIERRARYRWDAARAACMSMDVVDSIFATGGAHGINMSDPLQRHFRDAKVMAMHAYTRRDQNARLYGKATLGYNYSDYLL